MTGNNEKKALSILKEHNKLLSDQFATHNGCIIKKLGDGYLTEFSNSLDSVNSAIAIQHSLYLYNATQEMDKNFIDSYYHNLYILYFYLNDTDSVYKWYYRYMKKQNSPCLSIIYDPWYENARKYNRYIKLLKEMKL